MPFLDWLPSPAAKIPPRILRAWGGVFVHVTALLLDAMTETAKQAIKVRFPSLAPPDGLRAIGEERGEARATAYLYEDDFAFAERLRKTWSRRRRAGTRAGLVRVFEAFGFPSFQVYDLGEWLPSYTWHTWVYLPKGSHPWGPGPVVDDGSKVGEGKTVGSSLRSSEVRNLREVTASWCSPHVSTYLHLQTVDGPVVGDGSDVGDGSVVGGKSCKLKLGKATLS